MTVWIYVDTSKQVGDRDHLKVFASEVAADTWLAETTRRALRSSMTFWNEPKCLICVGTRPTWRHLLIRDDPAGAFGPGNARWRVAARYRWRRNVPAGAGD
jgi:hypothetical protein